jgi:virulence-associated protein VagC
MLTGSGKFKLDKKSRSACVYLPASLVSDCCFPLSAPECRVSVIVIEDKLIIHEVKDKVKKNVKS